MFSLACSGSTGCHRSASGLGSKHSNIMRSERECQTRWMKTSETKTIEVVLNGERRTVPAGLTVDRLLAFLEMNASRVAVELDRAIVRKSDWPAAEVRDGAELEVVWFVGGG